MPSATSPSLLTFPSPETVVAQFEAVAFGHEHGAPLGALQKWDGPIKLGFFVAPSVDAEPFISAVDSHLPLITALTGLAFRASARFEEAPLRLGVVPRAQFRTLSARPLDKRVEDFLASSACVAIAASSAEEVGRIEQGTIVVGSDVSASLQRHCLLEELVQVLGLPNDACHYRPSLFCEDDHVMELTAGDRILLRTLYDERLSSGMTREETVPIVRAIVTRALTGDIGA